MSNAEVEHGSEAERHMNRSSIGIFIGVVVAVLLLSGGGVGTLLMGVVLGAVVGAYGGAMLDVRGMLCDALKSLHGKLDPYVKNKPGDKKGDESDASES